MPFGGLGNVNLVDVCIFRGRERITMDQRAGEASPVQSESSDLSQMRDDKCHQAARKYSNHHRVQQLHKKMAQRYTFLIHTFYATGHVLPMQAVAKALVDRGHKVVWMTHADQESRVLASGAEFLPTREIAAVDARLRDVNAPQPTTMDETVEFLFGGRVTAQVADLRMALAHAKSLLGAGGASSGSVDCLLHDALPHGAAAIHELGEVSWWATLGVVPMWTTEEAARTTLGTILSKPEIFLPCLNRQRVELGLKALGPSDTLHYSPLLHIQASCPDLEYGRTMPNTYFVGPLVTEKRSSAKGSKEAPTWWADVVEHPCVIGITQGTFAVDPTTLLIPAIEALCDDDSLLLVVPSMHATSIRAGLVERGLDLRNVRLAEWVPYDLLLPKCQILITNGGYGSVTQSLSHGVPLICAGTSEDKRDTAARMVSVGAGVDLGTDTPSSAQIKAAVKDVLTDEKYRDNARRVGKDLNGLGGAQRACELLEEFIGRNKTA
ncbi:hypothetical protein N0V82_000611 [Gnomoniopsis sp. IMI 355080]|nr:hypothetical protein N0V82_000611 [Gnomoniopsis sp. IMI 355080]